MATLQGKAVKNTYRQVLQIGANNVGVSGTLQPVQDGSGTNTALSLSTTAATVTGDLTITGDLIITGGGIQIQDLIDDTVATLIQNGTGITWAYNDTLRTLTPTITIATADGGAQADYFQFNTNANEASAVGKLKWNTTDGTMDIGLMGGNVVLQVGQEQVARVLNNSGTIFTEAGYQAVKITSAQGQRLAVGLAQANNEANSKDTLGLVTENIANNQEGFVTTSGLVREIDTTGDLQAEVWIDGDTLYLSPSVPGGVTKVKPTAPQQTVIVGFVVYAHKNHGKIFVKVDNGYEITELHDVKITSVANNNILKYNSSLSVWENVAGTTTNISEGTNLYYTQARFNTAFAGKTTTDLVEGTNLYFTEARGNANFATNFATKDTDDLPEGTTNLYYTNARSRNALSVTAGTGISYNSSTGNFELASIPNASLTNDEVTLNGYALALGGTLSLTTSDIAEGTNLYWTNARFDSRFSTKTTTDLAEGTNLYYTQTRFNNAFAAKSTTDLAEGTNLYYTDARARAAISENAVGLDYSAGSGILSLTSGYAIPTTVKLGEYDTAYNRSIVSAGVTGTSSKTLTLTKQDGNTLTASWTDQGITTINGTANQIATSTVGNTTTVGFTNDVTFPNNVVVSGNLTINGTATYVNTQSISSKDPLLEVANDNNTTDAVDIGYYGRYYDSAQTRVEFTGLFRDASDAGKFKMFTGLVDEPTNVVDTTGTGYTVGTLVANVEGNLAGTANAANILSTARSISATGDAAWSVSFDGSANATAALTLANTGVTASTYGTSTAVPTLTVDAKGRITGASNTNITFPVTTVNSKSGTVVLTTSDIAEGTNQYFTSGRAQSAISLTTTGTSGAATYSGGVFNIPTYIGGSGTANQIAYFDTTGTISSLSTGTYPSLTELSYVKGVTSSIQTQFSGKLSLTGGTLTGDLNVGSTTTGKNVNVISSSYGSNGLFQGFGTDGLLKLQMGALGTSEAFIYANTGSKLTIYSGGATALTLATNQYATFNGNVEIATTTAKIRLNSTVGGGNSALEWYVNTNYIGDITASSSSGGMIFNMGPIAGWGGYMDFKTDTSVKMRLANNGNLLVGTTSDNGTKLQVSGGIHASSTITSLGNMYISNSGIGNNTGDKSLTIYGSVGAAYNDVATLNLVQMWNGYAYYGRVATQQDTAGGNASAALLFYTSYFNGTGVTTAERARITSSGFFLVGQTTPIGSSYKIQATGSGGVLASGTGSGDASFLSINNAGGFHYYGLTTSGVFYVSNNGDVRNANNSYGAISDISLKENITDATPKLQDLLKVKIRNYNLISDESKTKQIGVIAQELEEVFPGLITEDKLIDSEETIKTVKYSVFVPMLIKAIQELKAEIDELKAK